MTDFKNMPYGKDLLLAMYHTPSRELNADAIAAILQEKLAYQLGDVTLTKVHVSALYEKIGLQLKNRKKVAEKEPEPAKPTLMEILLNGLELDEPLEAIESGDESIDENQPTEPQPETVESVDEVEVKPIFVDVFDLN